MSQPIQIKLLHVLQERRFTPVGSHDLQRFSGRIIAATNRPLVEIRSRRILRDDFYYRLCSDVIVIPSLAERIGEDPAELDDLLDHTVGRILGKPSREVTDILRNTITVRLGAAYSWPGNVRELEQCIRRILLNRTYDPVYRSHPDEPEARLAVDVREGNLDAQGLLAAYCHTLYRRKGTIEAVARQVLLDRRTVKKHIEAGRAYWEG